jgi:PKD repeat protein
VLVTSDVCDFTGDIKAQGAHAISDAAGIYWSSGAAGGGRVKLFYESDLTNTGAISVRQGFTLSSNTLEGEIGTIFTSGDSSLFFPKASIPTDVETNVVLATLSGSNEICEGDSLTITATVGFTGYDFLLNGNSIVDTTNNQITIGGITSGDKLSVIASSFGCTTTSNEIEISAIPAITADFTSNGVGTTINFTNNSTNGANYFWEFGDGTNSNLENPTHEYATVDTFTVCLTTSNTNGCPSAIICDDIITSCTNPIANQHLSTTGLQLFGTDSSLNSTGRTWYIDNQVVSVDSVFTYTFLTPGDYEVCLFSNNLCAQDSICTTITVCELPVSYFTNQIAGSIVSFIDSSSSIIGWEWDFGNGTSFSGATPSDVMYPDSNATYTVCLTTVNECDEENVYCDDIVITSTTSVAEITTNNIVLYPNPANDYINIKGLASQANYVIYDIAGAIIKQGSMTNGQTKISTFDIVSGTYFLQFQIENKSIVKPIAIMH